jgi:hypothetical protein
VKAATLSTESIASQSQATDAAAQCVGCGSPLAPDQRYCLECGERRLPMSSVLAGGMPGEENRTTAPVPTSAPPTGAAAGDPNATRNGTLTVIAGVGVLLLAMGVGVLIGRSGASKQGSATPPVITVAGAASGTATTAAAEPSFTDDWPAATKGFTVQLQTLPQPGATVSAVAAAKSAATAKGAKAVGALKSEDFSSLSAGHYVVYAGVYHKRSEAQKALSGLKKSFPGAVVIEVSSGAAAKASAGASGAGSSGAGSNINHPAPPSVLEGPKSAHGKSYVEKSKNLPNVVSTG